MSGSRPTVSLPAYWGNGHWERANGNEEGTAVAALQKGLQDLGQLCDVVAEEFWAKREKFEAEKSR